MTEEPHLPLFDLAICLSDACDLVSPALTNHHKQVAYIAFRIGRELGLEAGRLSNLVLAGAMHDIGALSLRERIDIMEFESKNTSTHAEVGFALLRLFGPARQIAEIVRQHHHYWDGTDDDSRTNGSAVPMESDIIHIADRIALLIDTGKEVIGQVDDICQRISEKRGTMFSPEVHDAFIAVSAFECFWLDAVSPTIYSRLRKLVRMDTLTLDLTQLNDLSILFSRIIDFRSRFTATHSAGVAAVAETLAQITGFSKRECNHMRIAGLLHDLGKLAVPREILEKPGKLEKAEFDVIRTHTYHTYRLLDRLEDFETINAWGSLHHERLNGKGYPFHYHTDDITLGSRIMCVADIFTAITEDRPYRNGVNPDEAVSMLVSMANHGFIDVHLVELLKRNSDVINTARVREQFASKKLYEEMFNR